MHRSIKFYITTEFQTTCAHYAEGCIMHYSQSFTVLKQHCMSFLADTENNLIHIYRSCEFVAIMWNIWSPEGHSSVECSGWSYTRSASRHSQCTQCSDACTSSGLHCPQNYQWYVISVWIWLCQIRRCYQPLLIFYHC